MSTREANTTQGGLSATVHFVAEERASDIGGACGGVPQNPGGRGLRSADSKRAHIKEERWSKLLSLKSAKEGSEYRSNLLYSGHVRPHQLHVSGMYHVVPIKRKQTYLGAGDRLGDALHATIHHAVWPGEVAIHPLKQYRPQHAGEKIEEKGRERHTSSHQSRRHKGSNIASTAGLVPHLHIF